MSAIELAEKAARQFVWEHDGMSSISALRDLLVETRRAALEEAAAILDRLDDPEHVAEFRKMVSSRDLAAMQSTAAVSAREIRAAGSGRWRSAMSAKPRQVSGSSTQTWGGKDAVTVTELDWDSPRPILRVSVGRSTIELDAKQWGFVASNAKRLFLQTRDRGEGI